MNDEIGCTRYVITIGRSAIAASSVVVPDLQIPASAAVQAGTRRRDASRGLAKHRPVTLHLLRPAAGKQSERGAGRIETEHAPRIDARGWRWPVLEGMTDERGGDPALAEEFLLERQNDRELIHGGELPHALRPPGPHLRRDVIEHGNAGGGGGSGGPEVIARVIHEDHEIVALVVERLLDPVQQAVVRRNLLDRLYESDDGVRFHPVEDAGSRALQQRAAKGFQLEPGKTAA